MADDNKILVVRSKKPHYQTVYDDCLQQHQEQFNQEIESQEMTNLSPQEQRNHAEIDARAEYQKAIDDGIRMSSTADEYVASKLIAHEQSVQALKPLSPTMSANSGIPSDEQLSEAKEKAGVEYDGMIRMGFNMLSTRDEYIDSSLITMGLKPLGLL